MVEKLAEDLPKWECESLVETFRQQKIDHKALACLIQDEKEFRELVKEYGHRLKLRQAMQNIPNDWAHVVCIEHVVTGDGYSIDKTETPPGSPPQVAQREHPQVAEVGPTADTSNRGVKRKRDSSQKHSDVKNSVRWYLDQNTTGKKYLGLYNNKGFDKGNTRSDLSQYIVDCEINSEQNPDKVIPPSRFLELRAEIVAVFPKEIEATYYIPRRPKSELQGAKQPKGKLYDKYTALAKELRQAGLRDKGSNKDNPDNIAEDIDDPDPERVTVDDLQTLQLLVQTEGETQLLWRKTSAVRLHTLRVTSNRKTQKKQDKAAITVYCNKYKALRSDWGHSLLSIDFDYLYDGTKLCLMQEWKSTIALKIKCMSGLPLVYKDTIQEDVETLLLIPKLFGAINVGKWKVSSSDIQTGFLHHIVNGADLDAEIVRLSLKLATVGKTLQPFPIIVAADLTKLVEKPPVFYVYIDNFYYFVRTPLEAIDLCFKAYHALHADYPYQSLHPWLFLQKAVYGIITQWDPQIPPVERRVHEFTDLDV